MADKTKNQNADDDQFPDLQDDDADEFFDGDLDDESWDDSGLDEEDESAAPPASSKKKGGRMLKMAVIGIVVIVGGLYMLGRNSAPTVDEPADVSQTAANQTAPENPEKEKNIYEQIGEFGTPPSEAFSAPVPDAPAKTAQGGFLNNPERLNEVENMRDTVEFEEYTEEIEPPPLQEPPMPAPVIQSQNQRDQVLTPLPEDVVSASRDALPALQPRFVTGENEKEAAPPEQAPLPAQNEMAGTPKKLPKDIDVVRVPLSDKTPAQSAKQPDAPTDSTAATLASINEKLFALTGQMDDFKAELADLRAVTEEQSDITELKQSVAALEKKVGGLAAKQASAPAATTRAEKKTSAAPVPTQAAASKPVASVVKWVLKSAQPGKAIVSKAGENEVYSVAVGDQLNGIGKISFIGHKNGLWIVQGSTGNISQ